MPSSAQARHSRYSPSVAPPAPIQLEGDAAFNELKQIAEIEKCRADPVYFICNYCYVYETRPEHEVGWKLFKLWPKQEEYVRFLEYALKVGWRESICEKCRTMGATLLTLAWILWHWLFDKHFNAIIATLEQTLLKTTPGHDTLFAKLSDYLEKLGEHSPWLLPEGFDLNVHQTSMNLLNPANKNTVVGRLGTERFGRAARAAVLFRDESAFWNIDTSENTAQTAQFNLDVSTVNGLNFFHDNGEAAASYEPSRKFVFDWWDDPTRDQAWFEAERDRAARKGSAALARFKREVLRDKHAIEEGQIYPNIERCVRGNYDFNPAFSLYNIWDYGWTDIGYLGFLQRDPDTGDLYMIDEVYNSHVSVEWYVPFVPGKVLTNAAYRYQPAEVEKINLHKGWQGNVDHYGDPTGNQRTAATGQSVFDILKQYGIRPKCKSGWNNMGVRQEKTSLALLRLHIDNKCKYFYDSFTQLAVPKRAENSQATTPQNKTVHTWSHAPSAFEAFCISEPPLDQPKVSNTITFSNPWQARPTTFDRTA